MPKIKFDYQGQTFKAEVADSFLKRDKQEQARILKQQLIEKYDTRKPEPTGDKGVLDYLSLLERPAQAIKVGLRESELGGNVFRALGGVDLTPEEGVLTAVKRGWMGEDEVRTQDFLPENLSPLAKGVLGFAGDVATDPLTWYAPALVRGAGKLVSKATPDPVKEGLKKAGKKVVEQKFGEARVGLPDLARMFNVPIGPTAKVGKDTLDQARAQASGLEKELAERMPQYDTYFNTRAKELDLTPDEIKEVFRREAERARTSTPMFDEYGQNIGTNYYDEAGELLPLSSMSDESIEVLGTKGIELLNDWEDIGQRLVRLSGAFGQPIEQVAHRGYFPGVLTERGRTFVRQKQDEAIGEVNEFGEPIYRAGYRGPREEEALGLRTLDEVNAERAVAMEKHFRSHGLRPNPLDKPYEFFQTDPTVAMGMRWSRQNMALQKKWFIDEITDSVRVTGPMGTPFYQGGVKVQPFKNELGVGKWVKKDPENPKQILQRDMEPSGNDYTWNRFGEDAGEWRKVEGLPTHYTSDDVLDDEWLRVFREEVSLRVPTPAWARIKDLGSRPLTDEDLVGLPEGYMQAKKIADASRLKMLNDTKAEFWAPKQVSRQIEDYLSLMRGDIRSEEEIRNFLKWYDKTQNAWKAWTLGVRPAYHTRNAIGNMMNAYLVTGLGANIPEAVEIFKNAAKLQYYSRFRGEQALRDEFVEGVGSTREFFENIPPNIKRDDWLAKNFSDTNYSMSEIAEAGQKRGITAGHYRNDNIRELEATREAQIGKGSVLGRTLGAQNPAVQFGFGLGGTIEGNARYGVFIHTLREIKKNPSAYKWIAPDGTKVSLSDKGARRRYFRSNLVETPKGPKVDRQPITRKEMEMDIATMQVKGSQFDYMDVSKFERDWLKRSMPFYTWTRKNIPIQLKHLVLNPQRAEKLHLAKEQFEHESGDLDWSDYGAFWGNRVPVFLGKESGGVIEAFTLLNVVPMADLQRMVRPKELITEMISPFPKTLFEHLANYDTFRKSKVQEYPGETKDMLGVSLPARAWHLAQIIVPLTEIDRLNPAGVFGERLRDPNTGKITTTEGWAGLGAQRETRMDPDEVARWVRFFSGQVIHDVDMNRHRYLENKNIKADRAKLLGKMKWSFKHTKNRKAQEIIEVIEAMDRQENTDPLDRR